MTYIQSKCPYCATPKPATILLESFRWLGSNIELEGPCWVFEREFINTPKVLIPNRLFDEFTMTGSDIPELELTITDEAVLLKKTEQSTVALSIAQLGVQHGGFQKLISQTKLLNKESGLNFWMFVNSKVPRVIHCTISRHLS